MNDEERDKKLEDIHNNNKKELDAFMNREDHFITMHSTKRSINMKNL